MAAETVGGSKHRLVGHVVTDRDRAAALEGRFGKKRLDGMSFAGVGRADFDHHFAALKGPVRPGFLQMALHRLRHLHLAAGCMSKVDRDGSPLVFDDGAGPSECFVPNDLFHLLEGGRNMRTPQPPCRIAAFRAMQAGDGKAEWRKKGIDEFDGPAGHQCQRAAELAGERMQRAGQIVRNDDRFRPFGKIEQRSVDIEEQGPVLRIQ